MAYYFIFPEKDATLYSHPERTRMNTGADELLEIVKEKGTGNLYYPSRALIQFKNEDILSVINDKITPTVFTNGTSQACLQLSTFEHKNLANVLNLEVFAISQSWDEGTGRYSNLPTGSNGCSWEFRDNDTDQSFWVSSSLHSGSYTSSLAPGTTASFGDGGGNSSNVPEGGGAWYTGSEFQGAQQFLIGDNLDTDIDVTDIVIKHHRNLHQNLTYPLGIPNQGFIVKQPEVIEEEMSASFGEMKYFSVNTHTIYPPKLAFKWDDSSHNSQSLAKQKGELSVSLYRNQEEYNQNDEATFRVHVRDKYPIRQFASSSNFLNVGYFTTSSFYSIRDAHTEEEIIPFDTNFTKMSADNDGMFFKIFMKGLQPERYYRVLFKHTYNEGTTVYDDNYHFKVVR